MTTVYHVDSGTEYAYTLSPDLAVIAAYEQCTRNNWHTWNYRDPSQHPGYRRTQHGHACNGYWAKAL